jgi:hypothetical protein
VERGHRPPKQNGVVVVGGGDGGGGAHSPTAAGALSSPVVDSRARVVQREPGDPRAPDTPGVELLPRPPQRPLRPQLPALPPTQSNEECGYLDPARASGSQGILISGSQPTNLQAN